MASINLYFRIPFQNDRFVKGDRYLLWLLKKLFRKKRTSGIEKVFVNLCKGLDELNIDYTINKPFQKINTGEPVVVLGSGKYALNGYQQSNPIIAGIGLMTHPNEWPTLFEEYPVAKYLQHSAWTDHIYAARFGPEKCAVWPAGIETGRWAPNAGIAKQTDFLIYNKMMWNKADTDINLRIPLLQKLDEAGFTYREIVYGNYTEAEYVNLLQTCRAMIFLCEHESQGFACCEAMAMNVPVLAWDQGYWLDPNRFMWDDPEVKATSVPFFDERCGLRFKDFDEFKARLEPFWKGVAENTFAPRAYILQTLTLKKSAEMMLGIIDEVYKTDYLKAAL